MDIAQFVPILVEATKFLFGEATKWIDHARERSNKESTSLESDTVSEDTNKMTQQDFVSLESNIDDFVPNIKVQLAETHAYMIAGLMDQIKIHQKSLVDLEKTEAEFGPLTPIHIKRGIEREANAIVKKTIRLQELLQKVYGKSIEL